MKSLCIKTNNSDHLEYLLDELNSIDLENICFSCNEFKHYKNIIIHYTGKKDFDFLCKISSTLSLFVIDVLEENIVKRILNQNYFYFSSIERDNIVTLYFDLLIEDFNLIFDKKFNSLYNSFFDFISSNKSIVLDGFINFRIKKYMEIIDDLVNEAVNNFIIEKEYQEFISLLNVYINSQPTNISEIHIIYSNTDSILLDENKNIIPTKNEYLNSKYLSDISFSTNDYTLNTLLTLTPKDIYIHLIDNYMDEFINTLQLIFEKRIHLCTDCNICHIYNKTSYPKI